MRDVRWILTVSSGLAASAADAGAQYTVDPVTTTDVSGFRSTEVTWLAAGLGVTMNICGSFDWSAWTRS